MFKSDTGDLARRKIDGWGPLLIALSAIVPVLATTVLIKQSKEVTATIYSAYLAIVSVLAAGVAEKKGKRSAMTLALFTCTVCAALLVTYACIAFKR
jgi:fucose permease